VRRNDFKSKFLLLTGGQTELNDDMRRISFQEHFIDLTEHSLKIIRRPINTQNMVPFHISKLSKIREMLDLSKTCFVKSAAEKSMGEENKEKRKKQKSESMKDPTSHKKKKTKATQD
jgi:hypothetical protein